MHCSSAQCWVSLAYFCVKNIGGNRLAPLSRAPFQSFGEMAAVSQRGQMGPTASASDILIPARSRVPSWLPWKPASAGKRDNGKGLSKGNGSWQTQTPKIPEAI
ncbi:hypothetical protein SKAU_G00204150 [Synaphobranchus kaupii]|uniref:Uncharacterized protein n=1 Tax=Synaphobranchus kaupii TaxID=118154 RepID=A0A9Q1FG68_SYNKA|nr:hypothetical protein SKAU_G00204150 [Synaphobranchus kaupii]